MRTTRVRIPVPRQIYKALFILGAFYFYDKGLTFLVSCYYDDITKEEGLKIDYVDFTKMTNLWLQTTLPNHRSIDPYIKKYPKAAGKLFQAIWAQDHDIGGEMNFACGCVKATIPSLPGGRELPINVTRQREVEGSFILYAEIDKDRRKACAGSEDPFDLDGQEIVIEVRGDTVKQTAKLVR